MENDVPSITLQLAVLCSTLPFEVIYEYFIKLLLIVAGMHIVHGSHYQFRLNSSIYIYIYGF